VRVAMILGLPWRSRIDIRLQDLDSLQNDRI
jgi:hypothetical protein